MRVLIGCEESGVMCSEFRKAGHEAYSCDLQPTRGNPDWHYRGDVKDVMKKNHWDLMILHPDCTRLAVSGNRWYGRGMPKHEERLWAIDWTLDLWERAKSCADRVALENPVSVIFKFLPNVFYTQPWEHGHGETKKTGFALHNLDPLTPTDIVEGREQKVWKMAPSPTRKRDRSVTYQGIAEAAAKQWGEL